jgi:hypothetical protein
MSAPLDDEAGYPPSIADRESRFQIPLSAWFYAVAVVAAAFAAFGSPEGFLVAALILFGWLVVFLPMTWLQKGVIAAVVLVLLGIALPGANSGPRPASRRSQCQNNLKQLSLALHTYHSTYGSFPPAYVLGPDGTPWHSWRVLVLPYIEEGNRYDRYRFDEPWDGPHNRLLASPMPAVLACPSHDDAAGGHTSYFAILGTHTMWPGGKATKIDDIQDGTTKTMALVEYSGRKVSWMAPVDIAELEVVEAFSRPNPPDFAHGGAAVTARADGSVKTEVLGSDPDYIASLCEIDDGRQIPETQRYAISTPPRSPWPDRSLWPGYFRISLLVVIGLLPLPWAVNGAR